MAQTIEIQSWYSIADTQHFELPDGAAWSDVADFYVKWGSLHVCIKGQWHELTGSSDVDTGSIDFKRPIDVYVHPVAEDGRTDYETLLGEHH